MALAILAGMLVPAPGSPGDGVPARLAAQADEWEVLWLDDGETHTQMDPNTDYIIMLPGVPKVGSTILEGGRDVIVPGGHIVMDGSGSDAEPRAIYIKDATGSVRIENVFIEGDGETDFDAIAISAPEAVVELINIRVEGVRGTYAGYHGDIVQPFGGVRELFVDGLTGYSNYQGFYLQQTNGPIGSVELRNVNLAYDDNPEDETTFLLWLDGCETFPVTLHNVYIEPREGQSVGSYAVRPNDVRPRDCRVAQVGEDEFGWPDIPAIDGVVIAGTPPDGDFVPAKLWRRE